MPTYSKISTLPTALRNLVNEMLDAQKPQAEIAERITKLLAKSPIPEIAAITVSQVNVSNWAKSGYRQWQAQQKARDLAEKIALRRGDGSRVQDASVADNIADCILGELAVEAAELVEAKIPTQERRERIQWLIPQLSQLRRGTHAQAWIKLEALKLELAISKRADQLEVEESEEPNEPKGISDELMEDLEMALKLMDSDENYEYKLLSREDVKRIRAEGVEMAKLL